MTKAEWIDWKQNPITKQYYDACRERIEEAKDILSISAGLEPDQDNMLRGFIKAYREMLDFEVVDD